MKRWAVFTVLIYALALLLLTVPVVLIAFTGTRDAGTLKGAASFYLYWFYWLWFVVLVAGQALLLLLPIDVTEKRLPARRKLKIPIIVTAFFLANLCFAGMFSIFCLVFEDNAFDYYDLSRLFTSKAYTGSGNPGWTILLTILVFWLVWAFIFFRSAKSDDPNTLIKRTTRWLLRASILELLVAVPSHVIVRRRDDCCAPMGTFWGIATGISVMLLCFGPGVYFLFVERFKRLQAKPSARAELPAEV